VATDPLRLPRLGPFPDPCLTRDHVSVLRRQPADEHPGDPDAPDRPRHGHHPRLRRHGRRSERRRRLCGAARSRLRRLLRNRRLHGGLARLRPVPAGQFPLRCRRRRVFGNRHPHFGLARAPDCGRRHGDRRHPDRPADPAATRGCSISATSPSTQSALTRPAGSPPASSSRSISTSVRSASGLRRPASTFRSGSCS
jgi:hypothetical protein